MSRSSPKRFANHNKTKLSDYVYKIAYGVKQASVYRDQAVFTYLYSEDICSWRKALDNKTEFGFSAIIPKRSSSTNEDVDLKAQEDKDYEKLFKVELQLYLKQRKRTPYSGPNVQSSCSIRFGIIKIICKNDPIKLLKTIEIHSLTYEENRYDVQIIDDALKNLIIIKQKDKESLIHYTARFESVRDIAVAHLGWPIENDTSSTTKQEKTTTSGKDT